MDNKDHLTAEFDITSLTENGSLYIDFYALKEPKSIFQKLVRWYLRKYANRPLIVGLTTKEYPFTKTKKTG